MHFHEPVEIRTAEQTNNLHQDEQAILQQNWRTTYNKIDRRFTARWTDDSQLDDLMDSLLQYRRTIWQQVKRTILQ